MNSRRLKILVLTFSLLFVVFLNGCSESSIHSQNTKQQLTVATYGGEWGKALTKYVIKPFEKKYGVNVVQEVGVSSVTISKLQQQKNNPMIDVAWLDGGSSEVALAKGLLAPIDTSQLTNLKDMTSKAIYKDDKGKVYAIGTGFYGLGLVYNKEKVKSPPHSWKDLWNPEFERKVTVPSPTNTMGLPFLVALSKTSGGSDGGIKQGIQKLKKLKVSSFYDSSGNATNLFTSGEVVVGAHYANAAYAMADQGKTIGYVVPKEGALAGDIRLHLVKGGKHQDLALKFINFAISKAAQKGLAQSMYVAPVNKKVKLSEKGKTRMPWGRGGSFEDLVVPNWKLINTHRDDWSQLFNNKVVQ